jgi:predicted transcriptional regulator
MFARVAESLRQYRRADLHDFEEDLGAQPVEALYVDPLPSDGVLNMVLSSNTTFLLGRKGTGKSTIFSRAQSEIRKKGENIPVYVDVKALYDLLGETDVPISRIEDRLISENVLREHLLRKTFLSAILADLIKELRDACERLPLWSKLFGSKKDKIEEVRDRLARLQTQVKEGALTEAELPILRSISRKSEEQSRQLNRVETQAGASLAVSPLKTSGQVKAELSALEEALADKKLYETYSDAVLRSFPFSDILNEIKNLLVGLGLKRLVVFLDDFSEITWADQRLFVDTILAPLNNSSDERVKLKVAGYPGRVYYGRIDPGKVDTVCLDFSDLYRSHDIQTTENAAIQYTTRLLTQRFQAFGLNLADYFSQRPPLEESLRLMFETTFNVPRLMGYILKYCYQDSAVKNQRITPADIRLASQKYYAEVLAKYFDRRNRYALEPFDRKMDRHNQQELLDSIIATAREVRRSILAGEVGGTYFQDVSNPPVSHFSVDPSLESILSSLELNFLLSRYHQMRDKDGKDVTIYALNYGLCEGERLPWGYPTGRRDDRSYFVQRCFNFNASIHEFLAKRQTIRCGSCGAAFSMEKLKDFEFFKWKCPECDDGRCSVVRLADDYKPEIASLDKSLMLEEVEIDILEVLAQEDKRMRAKEISAFMNVSYQLVGKRTAKLQESGFVDKEQEGTVVKSAITKKARDIYFGKT